MIDNCLDVLETFLELKFTPEQRERVRQVEVDIWKKKDKKGMQDLLDNVTYIGKPDALKVARDQNQATFVESMRRNPRDPANAILLAAYNTAHPDRGEVMQARGLGQLVGAWKRQDGMVLTDREPLTGRLRGITATDSLVLNIFSDGRFHHLWSHSHCGDNNTCCNQYGTMADGTMSVEGTKLMLQAATGSQLFKAACNPGANIFQPFQQVSWELQWSLRRDPRTGAPTLCLSDLPFNPSWNKHPPGAYCYLKVQ